MYKEGDKLVTGHRLIKFLGRGNFGEVWQASAPGNTFAALKFLNLEQTQGRKEYRAIQPLKNLRHANLLQMTAIWLLDENGEIIPDDEVMENMLLDTVRGTMASVYMPPSEHRAATLIIAMPYADKSLDQLLQEYKQKGLTGIPRDELIEYMEDAGKAIDFLNAPHHDLGQGPMAIRHCDVKPENLLMMGQSVLLCDFGVSRPILGSSTARKTTMGGSLAYMAPECLSDEVTEYSDQFSLAISYLELRTGKLPFEEMSQAAVMDQRRRGILDLSELPKAEAAVIRRATSVNPARRYASALEMVNALREATIAKPSLGWGKVAAGGVVATAVVAGAVLLMQVYKKPDSGGNGQSNGAPNTGNEGPVPPPNNEWTKSEAQAYATASTDWKEAVKLLSQSLVERPVDVRLTFPSADELSTPRLTTEEDTFVSPFLAWAPDKLITLDRDSNSKLTLSEFTGLQKTGSAQTSIAFDKFRGMGLVNGRVLAVGTIADRAEILPMSADDAIPEPWKEHQRDDQRLKVHFSASGKNAALLDWDKRELTSVTGHRMKLNVIEQAEDADDIPQGRLSDEGDWIALINNRAAYVGNLINGQTLTRIPFPTKKTFEGSTFDPSPDLFSLQTGAEWGYVTLKRKEGLNGIICLLKFRLDDTSQFEFVDFQDKGSDAYCARLEKHDNQLSLMAGFFGQSVILYKDAEAIRNGDDSTVSEKEKYLNRAEFAVADPDNSLSTVSFAMNVHVQADSRSKWLVWGTSDGKLFMQSLDEGAELDVDAKSRYGGAKAVCFARSPVDPTYLYLDDTRLVVGSGTGVAVYNFERIRLLYEASKKAGKLLSVQPSVPLVKTET